MSRLTKDQYNELMQKLVDQIQSVDPKVDPVLVAMVHQVSATAQVETGSRAIIRHGLRVANCERRYNKAVEETAISLKKAVQVLCELNWLRRTYHVRSKALDEKLNQRAADAKSKFELVSANVAFKAAQGVKRSKFASDARESLKNALLADSPDFMSVAVVAKALSPPNAESTGAMTRRKFADIVASSSPTSACAPPPALTDMEEENIDEEEELVRRIAELTAMDAEEESA
jgi:hypothetical protein